MQMITHLMSVKMVEPGVAAHAGRGVACGSGRREDPRTAAAGVCRRGGGCSGAVADVWSDGLGEENFYAKGVL